MLKLIQTELHYAHLARLLEFGRRPKTDLLPLSGSGVADFIMLLYKVAARVPPSGPLRDELDLIRRELADPKTWA